MFPTASIAAAAVNLIYIFVVVYYGVLVVQQMRKRKQAIKDTDAGSGDISGALSSYTTEVPDSESRDAFVASLELSTMALSGLSGASGEKVDAIMNVVDIEARSPTERKHAQVELEPKRIQKKDEKQDQQDREAQKKAEVKVVTSSVALSTQDPREQKEQQKVEVIVVAKGKFSSRKSNQMSFCRGASIREVTATGNWHKGVLLTCCGSDIHPITGQILLYPSNFVRKVSSQARSDSAGQVIDPMPSDTTVKLSHTGTSGDRPQVTRRSGGSSEAKKAGEEAPEQKNQTRTQRVVVGKHAFKTAKRNQMSFCEGDLIQEITATGNWHIGILLECGNGTHAITGQKLYYPSNFIESNKL